AKLRLLRQLLERRGLPGAVLAGTAEVSWLSGGLTNRIEPGKPESPLVLVVTPSAAYALTPNVEQPRIAAESGLEALGFEQMSVPWHVPGALADAAHELAGAEMPAGFDDDLIALRLTLLPQERERLAAL